VRPGITVVIPTIEPRVDALKRAFDSVVSQTVQPAAVVVVFDHDHDGAAVTRHAGLEQVRTEWTAFLDDDDTMDCDHLQMLYGTAIEYGADYVWSRFRIGYPHGQYADGPAPLGPGTFEQWVDDRPVQTTITTLVRTELALKVGGFTAFTDDGGREIDGQRYGEDFDFTLRMRAAGAVFRHAPRVTWTWNHHGSNTSGRGDRW
jgi:GT2 family glycosyltransferase